MNKKEENKKVFPLHLIFGADEYEVDKAARATVDRLCPKESQAFGLEILEGAATTAAEASGILNACLAALRTVGFLGEGKVVWLRNAVFFAKDKLGVSADVVQAAARVMDYVKAGLPDGVFWVVSSDKVYKSGAFYKAAKGLADITEFQLEERSYKQDEAAVARAEAYFRDAGLSISRQHLMQFVERTGMHARQMVQDIEKIGLYLGEEKVVTEEVIDLLVPPTREALIWSLPEVVAARDPEKTRRMLHRLFEQKENAVRMIIPVEKHFARLAVLRACLDHGWAEVIGGGYRESVQWSLPSEGEALLEALGADDPRTMHPYALLLAMRQAALFSGAELAWCRERLGHTHYQMMNSPVPPELQLELVMLEISGRKPVRRRR
ncbi:MAG: hypothetical protein PHP44_14550 [Kiritimatiellae bacterium]|nr:hypothetical protein [Kiritimatiellia bacterium]